MSDNCDKVFKTMPLSEHGFLGFECLDREDKSRFREHLDRRNSRLAEKRLTKRHGGVKKTVRWKKTSDRKKRGISPYSYYQQTTISHLPLPGYLIPPANLLQVPCVMKCRLKYVDTKGPQVFLLSAIDSRHVRDGRIRAAELNSWSEKNINSVYEAKADGDTALCLPFGTALSIGSKAKHGGMSWHRGRISTQGCNYPQQGWREPHFRSWQFQFVDSAEVRDYCDSKKIIVLPKHMAHFAPNCYIFKITDKSRGCERAYDMLVKLQNMVKTGEDLTLRVFRYDGMRSGSCVYSAAFC